MNLYTCKHYLPNILIIVVILIPIAIGTYCVLNYNNPYVNNKGKLLREAIICIAVGMIFLSIYTYSYLSNFNHIYAVKDSDKLQTVEGQVSDLMTMNFLGNGSDSFYINGIEFFVSTNSLHPGYHKPAAYGGVINEEGMYVKITYIEYENNRYIMSIDIPE